uniref:Taste receptor type 2 n=1 Tax=Pyxicephalus adspersus TaxID=30357 RepID=A0AAV3A1X6_PYXAD|nr:TPA: hypothetical protein GDO54_014826 [Pyxicephalus adspersus]
MAGLFSNVFIIIYLTLTSLKERKVTTCNCILISLSISNLCFTILFSANSLIRFGFPRLFIIPNVFFVIYYLTFCSFSCISWLTFILCFFYFKKIQHFQPGFFAWIKKKIDVMVPWMMLAVLSVSLLSSYLLILMSNMGLPNNSTHTADCNFFAFKSWGYWMCLMLVHSSSAVYSLLIISGNPKLREAWVHLFTFRSGPL